MRNVSANTRKLTTLAMLAALTIVLVALIHFPLVPAAPFLEYDPADIPIFIGTFLFGPAAGLALTAVVCVIQGVTVSAASGPIGIIMHFLATGTFVLLAGNLYRAHRTRKAALLGLAAGTLAMTGAGRVCAGAHGGDVRVQPGVHAAVSGLFCGGSGGNAAACHHPVQPGQGGHQQRHYVSCV